MSSIPSMPQPPASTYRRSTSVVMGRQDFLSVLLRAVGAELYKIRRRLMSKLLLLIGILVTIIILSFTLLGAFIVENVATSTTTCTSLPGGGTNCSTAQSLTPAQKQQAQDRAHQLMVMTSASLRLPASFTGSIGIADSVGLILLIILTATVVGGEYSIGTVRLLLTRGPTRTQFLLAKILATLACILITLLILVPFGILIGALLNLALGVDTSFSFLNGEWLLRALLYLLTAALGIFVYTTIPLCLSLLGKATAAGMAVGIVWWFLEGIITGIIAAATLGATSPLANFIRAIPDYFISNNLAALLNHQAAYLTGAPATSGISDLHAWLVLVGWLVVVLGLTWWVHLRRDVTN